MTDAQKLSMFEARDAKRKESVKLYFIRRNKKIEIYKRFFEANATAEDKKNLKNIVYKLQS